MAETINVCHLRSGADVYGAETQIFNLCRIRRAGIDARLLFISSSDLAHQCVDKARALDISADQVVIRGKFRLSFAKELGEYIRKHDISILHCHDYKSDTLGFLAAKRAGIPIVATAHGFTEWSPRLKLYKHTDLAVLRRFDKIIAVSNWSRENLIKLGLPGDKVTTIYNSLDRDRLKTTAAQVAKARKDLDLRPGQKIVLAIGRLSPEKNFPLLLNAFSELIKDFPSARLIIAGGGGQRQRLEALATKLGLADSVTLVGYYQRVQDLMALADCVAVPSKRETLSMVTLEAMSAGKVVVAARVGGIPEILRHGETGLLVEPGDVDAFAAGLRAVIAGSIDAGKIGAAARERAVVGFPMDKMADETIKVYRDLLGGAVAVAEESKQN